MTEPLPLVSVHVTTYQRPVELQGCIEAVWRQSYRPLEIVVVDDHSGDETADLLQQLADRSPVPFSFAIHTENRGNAHARNTALSLSSGTYVAFLDDDDEWIDEAKVERQIQVFLDRRDDDLGIVCTRVRYVDQSGSRESASTLPVKMRRHILRRNGVIFNSTVITPRELLDRAGGFDVNIGRGVDSDYFRTCIVRLRRNVTLLQQVTTVVRADHATRMTSFASASSLRRELHSQWHTTRKFITAYLTSPFALLYRLRKIVVAAIRLLARRFSRG